MEPSNRYRALCVIGGCVMRDGICLNCGAVVVDTDNLSEPDEDQIAYAKYAAEVWDN